MRTGQRGELPLRRWPSLAVAQVIKHTTERWRLEGIPRRVVCGAAEQVTACFGGGVINTAWIERLNGTFRARVCALVRRGRALARQVPTLHGTTYLTGTVYTFCTPHGTLSFRAQRPTTPAMAARLTDQRWSVAELLGTQNPAAVAASAPSRPPLPSGAGPHGSLVCLITLAWRATKLSEAAYACAESGGVSNRRSRT